MVEYVVVSDGKNERMRVCQSCSKTTKTKDPHCLQPEQACIVVGALWSADLKMPFLQGNKKTIHSWENRGFPVLNRVFSS